MPSRAPLTLLAALVVLSVLAGAPAGADLVCPRCQADAAPLTTSILVELVITTILRHGVAVLVAGAGLVVGVPWAIAGLAVAAMGMGRNDR